MVSSGEMTENKFAIHEAAREGRIQAIEALLTTNPSLTQKRDLDDRLPQHHAATSPSPSSLPIIKLLSSQPKFNPDATDSAGWTAVMIASSLPQNAGLEIVRFLVGEKEADVNIKSSTGATAVGFAVSKQNLDVVKFLLQSGGSARMRDKRGQLPLHRAAAVGSVPLVKLLLGPEGKSPIDATDQDGMTALHHALLEGWGDVAVELLKGGADAGKRDKEERTALEGAVDEKVRRFVAEWAEREGVDLG